MKNHTSKKQILNPYTEQEGYNCFGCSPNNHLGLKMNFFEEGEYVLSPWEPSDHFAGYKKVLHGGIQATLLDEIASWCVQIKLKTAGVTANLNLRYKKPVYVNKGNLLLKAKIDKVERRIAYVHAQLVNTDNVVCCEGEVKYFIYPEEVAREKLYFPEFEKFFIKE
ncbi:MAG: PaaI family thioesterase [Bacteroidales bacterium]|nr:PaaI family thioesterase [Bacteroidales bacterium]MCF8403386.1 PaaI family thioesterase [Bacteroidales bacterium]